MVSVSAVEEGTVLRQAVRTSRGVLLAPEGTVLTKAHLSTFASWGVPEIDIIGEEAGPKREVAPAKVAAISRLLDERFSLVDVDNAFMREVRQVSQEVLVDRVRLQEEAEERLDGESREA